MNVFVALALAASPAEPAELEPVTVHASLIETTAEDMISGITVLQTEDLEAAGLSHFAHVLDQVPNLNWSSGTSRPRFFQIRGIGERSQYEGAPNPSVGFLIDDIDFSGIGSVSTLFDVDQVEVLRGPQGTRYGANALAGLIYVKTQDPTPDWDNRLQIQAGSDDTLGLGYAGGGPLSENVSYRVAIQEYQNNGFRENAFLDRDDTNDRDESTARFKLRWTPADWQVDLTALAVEIDNGFDAFVPDNGLTVYSDKPGQDAQDSTGLAVKAQRFGTAGPDFVSLTTWADSDILYSFDGDWGNDEFWGEFAPYDFTSRTDRDRSTISQEFRIHSNESTRIFNETTDWIAGLYILDLEEDNRFLDFFNSDVFRDLTSQFSSTNVAAYGELNIPSGRNTWTLGTRIERRTADYTDANGLDLNPEETMIGGQLGWSYDLGAGNSAFASVSRGFKAGGFNLGLSIPESRREYDAEYLWNLELGWQGRLADDRLGLRTNIFYSLRDDVQIGTSFQVDPTDPLTFVFFTDNAAEGTNYGVETELDFVVNDAWTVFGSLSLLETEFKNFDTPERALDGREQAHAPGYQFAAGTEYRHPNGWFGRLDITGRDDFYYSDSHDQRSEGYELVNLKLGYEAATWSVYAWGRNLTDETYGTRGFFFGVEPPDFPDRLYIQRGDPRLVGVTLDVRF